MRSHSITHFTILITFFIFFQSAFSQKASKIELPSSYDFDYIYKLKMTHKKGDMTFDYYLKKGGTYFGFDSAEMTKTNEDAKMFMVMDNKLNISAMFMEMMGKKVVQKTKLKASDFKGDTDASAYTFKKIESKTIMGFDCEGFVSENEDVKITFYITNEVPVSFNQVFGANAKKMPKGFNPEWMKKYADNGLMMEMIYVDKKKSKNSMTMQCVGLEKTTFSIEASKYGSMMSAFGG
ncbi:DUF4412 domain-containing protein [Psychroserpens sp. SPM9]|uniref:DUF4412 domain-containing protein n=1 Tax=Psychroserpens sp. SPM9 TaxID=2975598 RepID=UPI0021A40760|nr:DUF4412 domain-containing protein [Psychroserpens sp. SPM9]MDG5490821.1 DUF4412 domain-containing protein [Psychroserpens sp. SPM9]